jgi:DNA-binding GntR family transcriptional regulator
VANAADTAYEAIRAGILAGDHAQGDRLREEELADVIGVSRTPIREALRRLQADGLVELGTNRGAQVVSYTEADLQEIFDLRALIEPYAHGLAADTVDAATLDRLRELADGMEEQQHGSGDRSRGRIAELNREFHTTIVQASGSDRVMALLQQVVQVPIVHRTFHRYTPEALARSFEHHRELIDALVAGDGTWAAAVMRSHVHAARAALLGGHRRV